MRYKVFFYDPEYGMAYQAPHSRILQINRGEVGYDQFAGKVLNVVGAHCHERAGRSWEAGDIWRFDEEGFVDQQYRHATMRSVMELIFGDDPKGSAERKMAIRRAEAGNDLLINKPDLKRRLERYIAEGVRDPLVGSTRTLTRLHRA